MIFLYEWENKHNAPAAAEYINAAFGNGSVNQRTIRRWYANFETRDESLTKTLVDNRLLWTMKF